MIYLLHGPDTYSSRQKLREIIRAFQEKAGGGVGFTRVDAAEEPEAVSRVGRTPSLFAPRELLVIENASAAPAAEIAHIERQLPSWAENRNITVVFWEGDAAAGKSPLVAKIQKRAVKSQAFPLLAPAAVSRWLEREAGRRGLKLPPGERRLLAAAHGADLWALSGELEKIRHGWSLAGAEKAATPVWDFTDAFLPHRRRAFLPLARLLDAGFDAVYLLAALGGALRTVALVWRGIRSGKLKSMSARLHPFVVRKNLEVARRTDGRALSGRFGELIAADVELKTGRLPPPLPLVKLVLGGPKSKTPA